MDSAMQIPGSVIPRDLCFSLEIPIDRRRRKIPCKSGIIFAGIDGVLDSEMRVSDDLIYIIVYILTIFFGLIIMDRFPQTGHSTQHPFRAKEA